MFIDAGISYAYLCECECVRPTTHVPTSLCVPKNRPYGGGGGVVCCPAAVGGGSNIRAAAYSLLVDENAEIVENGICLPPHRELWRWNGTRFSQTNNFSTRS